MAIRIKVGDMGKLLSGDDAQPGSDQGRVSSINHATRTVVVEGMNKVKTSVRRSQKKYWNFCSRFGQKPFNQTVVQRIAILDASYCQS